MTKPSPRSRRSTDTATAAARITEAEYKKACDLLENEKFAEAIEAFTALGDYEDSKDRITEAEYRRAIKTFESGAIRRRVKSP